MKLYRIKNKFTGKYFTGQLNPTSKPMFSGSGVFFKRIDTVKNHLNNMLYRYEYSKEFKRFLAIEPYYDRLHLYQVVINDVTVNGQEEIDAESIVF